MTRMELLWEKRGFIKDQTNIVMLDDFLEACAHVKIQEVKVKRIYTKLDGTKDERDEIIYEVIPNEDGTPGSRPLQASPKQEQTIKPKLYNEDGSRCIDSMDEAELLEFSEIN